MNEIAKRLHEKRQLEHAKQIMESAGYTVTESTDSEYQMMKKQYPKSKEFKDKYKQSGELKDFTEDLDHQGKSYQIYDNRTDNGCTVFHESLEDIRDHKFKVGDKISYTMLYGGNVDAEVVSRSAKSLRVKEVWIAEDTGKDASTIETYDISVDDRGNEYIVVWEYRGEEGTCYPPEYKKESDRELYKMVYDESKEIAINEAASVGDELTYDGRPCIVAFIDNDDNEALLKFTDGKEPKKQFVSLDALENPEPEEEPAPEEPAEPEENYAEKYAGVLDKVDDSASIVDQLQTLFDELVPDSGKADTVAGELVRAMMRLLYRDYNDGDKFYEGYGLETCASSAAYLGYEWDNNEIWRKLESIAESVPNMPEDQGDARYTQALEDIAEMVITRVMKGEDFVKNTKDSRDEDISEIKEMEPLYDLDVDIPWEVQKHIEAGNITMRDLIGELSTWDDLRDIDDINGNGGYLTLANIGKELFNELEDTLARDLEEYGRYLDDEYGDPDEEEEEEED